MDARNRPRVHRVQIPLRKPFRPSVHLTSLGCAKNQVDSERLLALFQARGYRLSPTPADADILVVNTCAFIQPAQEEAVNALLRAAAGKRRRRGRVLAAAGCLVSRHGGEKLRLLLPEVDAAAPPGEHAALLAEIEKRRKALGAPLPPAPGQRKPGEAQRVLLSGPGMAYLKIAEGCSRRCRFCLIPRLRGPLRSTPLDRLAAEAEELARRGAGELILVAQDLTAYGRDLYGRTALTNLLDRLVRISALRWIRLLYTNPDGIGEGLIRRLAGERKICKYLDLPVQHAHRSVLRRMGRPGDGAQFLRLVRVLRRRVPGVVLRTTLLTGFPGESAAEHQALLQFVAQARFDRLGVFPYFREAGTPAASLPGQVHRAVRERRQRELLNLQTGISRERLAGRVGGVEACLAEAALGPGWVLGRTAGDAPEIDGQIILRGRARAGTFVRARVTGSTDHDLQGEIL